jgi:pimeloyl-ACP methyl ester carboxylesterase
VVLHSHTRDRVRGLWPKALTGTILAAALCACATAQVATLEESNPLIMVPVSQTAVVDQRARFRNLFCAVLEARANGDDADVACDTALVRLPDELPRQHEPVQLGGSIASITALFIAGLGSDCIDQTRQARAQFKDYLARYGYRFKTLRVSGISSSAYNARHIRDSLLAMPGTRKLVIIGHSKGVVDTLEAIVTYPELQSRINAIVSLAGAVGGSPLADTAPEKALSIVQNTPGLKCKNGDAGALESLRPSVRRDWLAKHPLPASVAMYSVITLPEPERISAGLKPSYSILSKFDPRNDGNLLFYDQVVPGSSLLAYANADHWAIATDLGASPYALVRSLADRNDFPREQLIEAILRFVETDLNDRSAD